MDTPVQAIASLNERLSSTASSLTTIASAATTVESLASQAVAATGTAPSSAQKLQAGIALATAIDPQLSATVGSVETIFGAVVGVLNLFGIFRKGAVQPAAAPV